MDTDGDVPVPEQGKPTPWWDEKQSQGAFTRAESSRRERLGEGGDDEEPDEEGTSSFVDDDSDLEQGSAVSAEGEGAASPKKDSRQTKSPSSPPEEKAAPSSTPATPPQQKESSRYARSRGTQKGGVVGSRAPSRASVARARTRERAQRSRITAPKKKQADKFSGVVFWGMVGLGLLFDLSLVLVGVISAAMNALPVVGSAVFLVVLEGFSFLTGLIFSMIFFMVMVFRRVPLSTARVGRRIGFGLLKVIPVIGLFACTMSVVALRAELRLEDMKKTPTLGVGGKK